MENDVHATAAAAPVEPNPTRMNELAAAIFNRAAAAAALEAAKAALSHGKLARLRGQQRLARYDDLEQRISEASAEHIRSGGTKPMPPKLEQEYDERKAEQHRLNLTVAGLAVLERDVAKAEQALREAEVRVTSLAADAMIDIDGAAILEEHAAVNRRKIELEELAEGLNLAVSAITMHLPADAKVKLASRLRMLREALIGPKRNPVPWGLMAGHNATIKAPWMERFNELTK